MKYSTVAILVAASLGLTACNPAPRVDDTTATVVSHNDSQPEFGRFGVDLSARDPSIKPGDDFFMYASGTWYQNYQLPPDKTRFGAFGALADRSEEQVKAIVDDIMQKASLNEEEQLIRDFFTAYMDIERINSLGLSPINDVLTEIADISDRDDLTRVFSRAWLTGVQSPLWGGMWYDRLDPNKYQLSLGVGGLGLPDRDYYLSDNERFAAIRAAYVEHITELLTLAGKEDAAQQAQRILALETQIAEIQWPREKRRDRDLSLNPIERQALATEYPGFNWDLFFAGMEFQVPTLNVAQPDPVRDVITIINQADLADWQAYLTYHTINQHADFLPEDIYNAHFSFYGKVLSGQQEPKPRWKRAISEMSGTQSLGFALGKLFVAQHFPESSKQQMGELVETLRKALHERVEGLDWMGEETKVNAKAKLAAFRPKIGYPDQWQSFAGLDIDPQYLVKNIRQLREFFHQQQVERELQPTDRERWGMTPQTVNAYYNSSFNEIVFPAAILQPPFFDPNADPAVNYGAIGAVIGHEMGHGFDDQGSKSDANGIQRNWWTDEDRAAFEQRAAALVQQVNQYEPIPGNFVNGQNSLGENIGDVGGLAMAYHAYKLSLNGEEAPVIDGVTGDQRFFLAWAQVWREKRTEESMLNQLRAGTHAPGRYRALAPRNHDAWYEAFDVKPGDALYLAPEERVRIW